MLPEEVIFDRDTKFTKRIEIYFKLGAPDITPEIQRQKKLVDEIFKIMEMAKSAGLYAALDKIKEVAYQEDNELRNLEVMMELSREFETYEDYLDSVGR